MNVIVAQNARRYFSVTMPLVVAVFLGIPSAGAAEDKTEYKFANVENLPIQKGLPDPFLIRLGRPCRQSRFRLAGRRRSHRTALAQRQARSKPGGLGGLIGFRGSPFF